MFLAHLRVAALGLGPKLDALLRYLDEPGKAVVFSQLKESCSKRARYVK